METDEAKEVLGEVIMHCEASETPPEHGDTLSHIYAEARSKGLPVDYDDGFERHGIGEDGSAIVLDCEDGDVVARGGTHAADHEWQVEVAHACEECGAVDTPNVDVDRVDDPGYGHPSGKVWLCEHCQ